MKKARPSPSCCLIQASCLHGAATSSGVGMLLRHVQALLHAQVLNDLLDPSRANLKLREDPKRGFYVEGIKEETLVSAEHALSIIATGVAHRKVRPSHLAAHHISPIMFEHSDTSHTCNVVRQPR